MLDFWKTQIIPHQTPDSESREDRGDNILVQWREGSFNGITVEKEVYF